MRKITKVRVQVLTCVVLLVCVLLPGTTRAAMPDRDVTKERVVWVLNDASCSTIEGASVVRKTTWGAVVSQLRAGDAISLFNVGEKAAPVVSATLPSKSIMQSTKVRLAKEMSLKQQLMRISLDVPKCASKTAIVEALSMIQRDLRDGRAAIVIIITDGIQDSPFLSFGRGALPTASTIIKRADLRREYFANATIHMVLLSGEKSASFVRAVEVRKLWESVWSLLGANLATYSSNTPTL